MKKNKSKSKRKNRGRSRARQPQRRTSANVRANSTKRRSQRPPALHTITQIGKRTSTRAWALFLTLAAILGFWLDVDGAISKRLNSKPPAAKIMYFNKEGSDYTLTEPDKVVLNPTQNELDKGYFAVPINLAVSNQEKARLEATRVEITYPKGLRVTPEGRPKIDPQNRTLIYEHDLRSLEPVESFTPLDTIDIIYLHYEVKGLRSTVVLHKNLVALESVTGAEISDIFGGLDLGVKVFSRGRPPVETKVHLSVNPRQAYGYGVPDNTYNPVPLREDDVSRFHAVSKRLRTANKVWEVKVKGTSRTLALARATYGRGSYSGLLLGGKVTEMFVDYDGDGMLDYHLVDSTDPQSPDQRLLPSQREPLTDMRRPDEVRLS